MANNYILFLLSFNSDSLTFSLVWNHVTVFGFTISVLISTLISVADRAIISSCDYCEQELL